MNVNQLTPEMSACYTKRFLARIGASLPETKLNSYLWRNLCNLGISRATLICTRRGCRVGRRKQQTLNLLQVSESPSPTKRICSSFSVHSTRYGELNPINLHHSSLNIPTNTVEKNNIPVIMTLKCLDARLRHRGVNRGNLIDVPCQENVSACKPEFLRSSLANCRSVRNKT